MTKPKPKAYRGVQSYLTEEHADHIHMSLLHFDESIIMNVKKIRRLMKKYGLVCPIRRANPYRIALGESMLENIPPNGLNCNFREY